MANPKDPVRLLGDDQAKNPRRVYGAQKGALAYCQKHGEHYPKEESCRWCLSWVEEQAERATRKTDPAPAAAGKTPGRVRFEARHPTLSWDDLAPTTHEAWEMSAKHPAVQKSLGQQWYDYYGLTGVYKWNNLAPDVQQGWEDYAARQGAPPPKAAP